MQQSALLFVMVYKKHRLSLIEEQKAGKRYATEVSDAAAIFGPINHSHSGDFGV